MATARQQINLLQAQLRDRKPVLPATHVLAIIALAALLSAVATYWFESVRQDASVTLQQLNAQLAQRQQALLELSESIETIEPDASLNARLLRSEQELERLRTITSIAHSLAPARPLSEFVSGFGRQRPQGLWLASLHIGSGGTDLVLQGHALEASLLPDYIAGLGVEPVFEGLRFGQLSLERQDDSTRWLDFRVVAGCRNDTCPPDGGGPR